MFINSAHYRSANSKLYKNGCRIHVVDNKVIAKNFIKTIVEFDLNNVSYEIKPDEFAFKVIRLYDAYNDYDFLFYSDSYQKLLNLLQ